MAPWRVLGIDKCGGLPEDRDVFALKLEGVKAFDSGAVWIRYSVK